MIGYVTVGSNDLKKAVAFYDALFADMGAGRFMDEETFVAWAVAPGQPAFSVSAPFDGNAATVGNGNMTALVVDATEKVDALYARAMSLGATDEGQPGWRMDGFYAAYFRDLDGNKLNFFFHQPAAN